jgi:hypothetical protein
MEILMNIYVAAKPGYVKLTDHRDALPDDCVRVIALDLTSRDVGWLALVLGVARLNIDVEMDPKAIA